MNMKTVIRLFYSLTACLLLASQCLATPLSIVASNAHQVNSTLTPIDIDKWERLQSYSTTRLTQLLAQSADPIENAWINLALISKDNNASNQQLIASLADWRSQNPSHPANELFPPNQALQKLKSFAQPKQIALLLPASGPYATIARTIRNGFLRAYHDSVTDPANQQIAFYDTAGKDTITALYKQAVNDGADFIVGPLTKSDVAKLNKLAPFSIPVLALNYTGSTPANPNFYEFGLLPEDDAVQIAQRAQRAGHSHAIMIAANNPWGKRLAYAFSTQWQNQGGTIEDAWYYHKQADFSNRIASLLKVDLTEDKKLSRIKNVSDELTKRRRQDFDVIILFAEAREANLIVPLLKFYYAGNIPIYATSAVYKKTVSTVTNHDLRGVIVCDMPASFLTTEGRTVKRKSSKFFAIGQDAYYLTQSLPRLQTLPNFPVYSNTGALIIDEKQQIHRHLPCMAVSRFSQYALLN